MTTKAPASTNARTATAQTPNRKRTSPPNGRARPVQGARQSGARRRSTTAPPSRVAAASPPAGRAGWGFPVAHGLLAADRAVQRNSVHVALPLIGEVNLPPKDELAFMGGIAGMAAIGFLEWPVALVLVLGHALASNRHNMLMQEFGKALEEA